MSGGGTPYKVLQCPKVLSGTAVLCSERGSASPFPVATGCLQGFLGNWYNPLPGVDLHLFFPPSLLFAGHRKELSN